MQQRFAQLILSISLLLVSNDIALGQLTPFHAYQGDGENLLRLQLKAGHSDVQLGLGPLTYSQVCSLLDSVSVKKSTLSRQDIYALEQFEIRTTDTPGLANPNDHWLRRNFYSTKGHAIALGNDAFTLFASPVLDLRLGTQNNTPSSGIIVQNTRGITVRGQVDNKVWFSTTLLENQARLPSWEREWRVAYNNQVPGVGFYKSYSPLLWEANDAVDYFQSFAEIGFNVTKHISFQFGHGLPRIGNGYRSLIIDNFTDPYLYGQIDTRVGRFHYRNLFASLKDGTQTSTNISRKFMASHTLGIQLTPSWEVGLTEIIVSARDNGIDAQYFNPVILYRAIEQDNGSPDNALIAAHSSLKLGKDKLIYGQFLLDEFKFDRLFGGDGWWANKYSWQLGGKWFDAFSISGLEVGAEYNLVRPFTYGHRFPKIALTSYNQSIAHPWGADLSEAQVRLAYAHNAWTFSSRFATNTQSQLGLASDLIHNGSNTLINNNLRDRDFGYELAGFNPVDRTLIQLTIEHRPIPGATIYLQASNYAGPSTLLDQQGVMFGLSLNAIQRSSVF